MSEKPLTPAEPNTNAAQPVRKPTAAERLRAELPSMKTAVLWSEILDKPLSRRGKR